MLDSILGLQDNNSCALQKSYQPSRSSGLMPTDTPLACLNVGRGDGAGPLTIRKIDTTFLDVFN
jgi:hypothetical protein